MAFINTSPHLNATRLAVALGRSVGYVIAMRACGYVFEFGTVTTIEHVRQWLQDNPDFRCTRPFVKVASATRPLPVAAGAPK